MSKLYILSKLQLFSEPYITLELFKVAEVQDC